MGYTAKDLIAIAEAEVGYIEKRTNANLDDPTANPGTNNWTKYARDLYSAGYYQASKNGYAWCDVFVDWCHYIASGKDSKLAQQVICQSGVYGATCTYSANYFAAEKRLDMNPRIGDQVFFKVAGSSGSSHTGIVTDVTNDYVYTIEGNSGTNADRVVKKSYKRSYSNFYGFGHPKYDDSTSPEPVKKEPEKVVTPSYATSKVTIFDLKRGLSGLCGPVMSLQILLNEKFGFNLEVDGQFGPLTQKAVMDFQNAKSLDPDGVVGPLTWNAVINGGAK